ncbi:MAG TPA: hypothetical protein VL001_05050 [Candidimonas sp.]|nr:hypothetical protein [Candidimonas sp.]
MNWPIQVLRSAVVSGSFASAVSTFALLLGGVRDCRSAIAPVNAVSHWIWKDKAIYRSNASVRYSLVGYAIHHAASIFWALAYEGLATRHKKNPVPAITVGNASAVAALACVVDLRFTPQRLTPGFERRLSTRSLAAVYVAFAVGLALHDLYGARK